MGINEIIQIGDRIRRFRTQKGLTQKEMAALAGIPYSTYSNYENNNREPGLEQLNKIANALDISLQNLIYQGSISTEMLIDTDEEATLYLNIISNLEKMNIGGMKEADKQVELLTKIPEYRKEEE